MGDFWQLTQQMLQGEEPLIKRPKLTDALLNKPPFRFLHDIISEVMRNTGFGEGLFTDDELVSTNIKDKDAKVAYLTKIISCVGLALDQNVPARPHKIVAGLEPENTNKFLQMLAQAATSGGAASHLAVQKVLAGEQMPGKGAADRSQRTSESVPPPPPTEAPPPSVAPPTATKSAARPVSSQSEAPRSSAGMGDPPRGSFAHGSGESRPSSVGMRSGSSGEPAAMPSIPAPELVRRASAVEAQRVEGRAGSVTEQRPVAPMVTSTQQVTEEDEAPRRRDVESGSRVEPPAPVRPQPATPAAVQRPGTATRGPMRPQSARRGPPKQPSNVVTAEKKPETRPASGSVPPGSGGTMDRPGTARKSSRDAPQPAAPVRAGVILDGAEEEDEEEVVTVVESHPVSDDVSLPEGAGKLVRDILETRKDLQKQEEGLGRSLSMNGKSDTVKKEELQKLRGVVQYLCQSATPLGKSMEYLQEDMENMAKEFQFWNKEKKGHAAKLEEERRLTQEALQGPLAQLAELEDEIKQKREALDTLKAQVWRNDETIEGLLKLVMAGPSGSSR